MVRKVRFRARLRSICVELYEVIRANRCLYLLTNLHWQAGFWEAGVFHLFLSEYVNQSHKFQKIEFLWRHPSLLYYTFFKRHYVISRMVLLTGSSSAIFCQLSVERSQFYGYWQTSSKLMVNTNCRITWKGPSQSETKKYYHSTHK